MKNHDNSSKHLYLCSTYLNNNLLDNLNLAHIHLCNIHLRNHIRILKLVQFEHQHHYNNILQYILADNSFLFCKNLCLRNNIAILCNNLLRNQNGKQKLFLHCNFYLNIQNHENHSIPHFQCNNYHHNNLFRNQTLMSIQIQYTHHLNIHNRTLQITHLEQNC